MKQNVNNDVTKDSPIDTLNFLPFFTLSLTTPGLASIFKTIERSGWSNGLPIGFSDLKIEALKQSKRNFQQLQFNNEHTFWRKLDDVITYNLFKLNYAN